MDAPQPTYTPQQMAELLTAYQRLKERHRESQKAYYARNADARKAYAMAYYNAKKAKSVQEVAK